MIIAVFLGGLVLLFLLGFGAPYAIGLVSMLVLIMTRGIGNIPLDMVATKLAFSANNFTLLAIPFFLLAGKFCRLCGFFLGTKRCFVFFLCFPCGFFRGQAPRDLRLFFLNTDRGLEDAFDIEAVRIYVTGRGVVRSDLRPAVVGQFINIDLRSSFVEREYVVRIVEVRLGTHAQVIFHDGAHHKGIDRRGLLPLEELDVQRCSQKTGQAGGNAAGDAGI